jgi:hypothetical protein
MTHLFNTNFNDEEALLQSAFALDWRHHEILSTASAPASS